MISEQQLQVQGSGTSRTPSDEPLGRSQLFRNRGAVGKRLRCPLVLSQVETIAHTQPTLQASESPSLRWEKERKKKKKPRQDQVPQLG